MISESLSVIGPSGYYLEFHVSDGIDRIWLKVLNVGNLASSESLLDYSKNDHQEN